MSDRHKGRQFPSASREAAVITFDYCDQAAAESDARQLARAFEACEQADREAIIGIVRKLNLLAEERGEDLAVAIGENIERMLTGQTPHA